jgi:hypothetical protein
VTAWRAKFSPSQRAGGVFEHGSGKKNCVQSETAGTEKQRGVGGEATVVVVVVVQQQ